MSNPGAKWSRRRAGAWVVLLTAWMPLLALLPSAWSPAASALRPGYGSFTLFARSLAVAGGSAGLALILGVPSALLLGLVALPARRVLRSLLVAPLALPPYLTAIGWLHLLGPGSSTSAWLALAGGSEGPFMGFLGAGGAIWVLGLWAYPLVALMLLAVLEALSPELVEQALLAGGWRAALRQVAWPAAAPALGGAALLVFILALGDFGVASFLGVQVYTAEIMLRFGAFYDVGAGLRALLPLALLSGLGYALLRRLTTRYAAAPLHVALGPVQRASLGRLGWPVAAVVLLPVLLATMVPLGALAARAPALQDYVVAWSAAHRQVLNSALLGSLAALVALTGAWPLARAMARGSESLQGTVQTLTLGMLAVPGLALGMGLIRLWNRAGLLGWVYGSPLMVIMAGALRGLPLAALALTSAWRQLPAEVEEAALVEGASPAMTRRRVVAPLLRPGLVTAWALACYRALTDMETAVLVHAPGDDTLPVRIYTLQHDGQAGHVAALSLMLVGLVLLLALGGWLVGGRLGRRAGGRQ